MRTDQQIASTQGDSRLLLPAKEKMVALMTPGPQMEEPWHKL
jgi:hypothetical protein